MPRPNDVGVGVALIVLNEKREILLGKRKGAHRAGHWAFPGGWIDRPDQSTLVTCQREALEEAGLTVHKAQQFHWTTEDHPEIEARGVTLYHVSHDYQWAGVPKVMEPHKCEKWEWFPLSDLPEPLFPGLSEAVDVLLERD